MRIVKLAEFLTLPPGTVFWKYAPAYTREMGIKGESLLPRDFVFQSIDPAGNLEESSGSYDDLEILSELEQVPSFSSPLSFDCMGRDGMFDEEQLFCVLERRDHERLIERLTMALDGLEP